MGRREMRFYEKCGECVRGPSRPLPLYSYGHGQSTQTGPSAPGSLQLTQGLGAPATVKS